MAKIAQILPEFWPNQEWTITEDNYETLDWKVANSMGKPTEAEVRARSAEVDVLLADKERRSRQQRALDDTPDYLLRVVETLIEGMIEIRRVVNDIRSTAVGAAHTGSYTTWDATIVSKIAALKQKVDDLRSMS